MKPVFSAVLCVMTNFCQCLHSFYANNSRLVILKKNELCYVRYKCHAFQECHSLPTSFICHIFQATPYLCMLTQYSQPHSHTLCSIIVVSIPRSRSQDLCFSTIISINTVSVHKTQKPAHHIKCDLFLCTLHAVLDKWLYVQDQ